MKKNVSLFLMFLLFFASSPEINTKVLAYDNLYHMGNSYNDDLASCSRCKDNPPSSGYEDQTGSTVVISVGALYHYGDGIGEEQVRIFSRNSYAKKLMDPDGSGDGYTNGIARAARTEVGLMSADSSSGTHRFSISGTSPAEGYDNSTYLDALKFDLLGYKGFGGTIKAIMNNFEGGTEGGAVGSDSHHRIEVFNVAGGIPINLPDKYTYTYADRAYNDVQYGQAVHFNYTLPGVYTNYDVLAYGRVLYQARYANNLSSYPASYAVYAWSGRADKYHKINRE